VAFASGPDRLIALTSFLLLTFVAAQYCRIFPSLDRKFSASWRLLRASESRKTRPIESAMSSLRVFLVENHEDTVRYMQLLLEQLGYQVCIAPDMATALREIPDSHCDVLISDIGLPDGDGWQLLERLGDSGPPFAIAMSGYGTGNDQRRSLAAGYDHHLIKPFTPDALLTILNEVDERKSREP
jgi:CheY-like chemotaxis protein